MTSKEHTQEVANSRKDSGNVLTIYRVQKTSTHTLYTKDGKKHRLNGPAMIAGDKEWFYINGYIKTPKEHALYKELYNNYDTNAPSSIEETYYSKASESPTSIYTTTEVTTSTSV